MQPEIDRSVVDEIGSHIRYCACCEINVAPIAVDLGIGQYEFWGSREVHKDLRDVCPNCGEEVSSLALDNNEEADCED